MPFVIFESLLIFDDANISIQIEIPLYLKSIKRWFYDGFRA